MLALTEPLISQKALTGQKSALSGSAAPSIVSGLQLFRRGNEQSHVPPPTSSSSVCVYVLTLSGKEVLIGIQREKQELTEAQTKPCEVTQELLILKSFLLQHLSALMKCDSPPQHINRPLFLSTLQRQFCPAERINSLHSPV